MNITWFDPDFYTLLLRVSINLVFLIIVIRYLYYPIAKRKDYLFTYFLIGFITFFLCFGLKKLDIDTGMGLGLFAIFGIIRYRTSTVEIKEMTYLFIVIGLSVINSLASNKISIAELALINVSICLLTYLIEYVFLLRNETQKTVLFERIDLIKSFNNKELKSNLEERTGLKINRVEVGKINYLNDTADVKIYYFDDEQKNSG
jgi:membrane-associated protease RseP (regulator of RpoE activity)